jgi:hypothetical protein
MPKEFDSVDIAKLNLDRIDKYINLANIKAALMLPANGLLLTLIYNKGPDLIAEHQDCAAFYKVILGLAILSSVSSFILASVVVKAFLKGKFNPSYKKSMIYFGSIEEMDLYNFIEDLKGQTLDTFTDDIAGQVHILTKALKTKFVLFNWSLFLLAACFSLLSIALLTQMLEI